MTKKATILCGIYFLFFFSLSLKGQSFWFGPKLGAAMNLQSWASAGSSGTINQDPSFTFNGDFYVESYDEMNKGALYAQLGYHTRGSSVRFFSFNNDFSARQSFDFRNIVLELGAKKRFGLDNEFDPYYLLGIRGEYTVGTNLDDYLSFGSLYYPLNDFVRKINYGVTFGGGFETEMSKMTNVFMEFTIQPDLSLQYQQPALSNVTEPFSGQTVNLSQRDIRNLSLELKVGIRFLRKVEYID